VCRDELGLFRGQLHQRLVIEIHGAVAGQHRFEVLAVGSGNGIDRRPFVAEQFGYRPEVIFELLQWISDPGEVRDQASETLPEPPGVIAIFLIDLGGHSASIPLFA